ncbi:Rrf2 family transcriptional regulator [Christensenella minuta]|nr:Rrf2 family transcriptional regulator [Christensenella minuta]
MWATDICCTPASRLGMAAWRRTTGRRISMRLAGWQVKRSKMMMRIQASTRYALRILQYLYGKGNRTVKAGELSGQLGLSSLYTAKVLGKLKESKVVRSEQGCYGGYRMASPAEKVSVYEVFIAMEGDFVLYEPKADGPEDGAEQTIREFFDGIENAMVFTMRRMTLKKLFDMGKELPEGAKRGKGESVLAAAR